MEPALSMRAEVLSETTDVHVAVMSMPLAGQRHERQRGPGRIRDDRQA